MIHKLPVCVVFLDCGGRIVDASPDAQFLLRAQQGLKAQASGLRAHFPEDDRRLQQAILRTARPPDAHAIAGDTVTIRKPDDKSPLRVTIIPLRSHDLFEVSKTVCMVVICDPEGAPKPAVAMVQLSLRLTEAEALLACVLYTGVSLRESAQQLGISINTCKTQLKSIYSKTGCRSHVDLVKVMIMASLGQSV